LGSKIFYFRNLNQTFVQLHVHVCQKYKLNLDSKILTISKSTKLFSNKHHQNFKAIFTQFPKTYQCSELDTSSLNMNEENSLFNSFHMWRKKIPWLTAGVIGQPGILTPLNFLIPSLINKWPCIYPKSLTCISYI
jgi:hypothetical protein